MKKKTSNEYHLADDGTMVEKSDWDWLQAHKKRNKKKKIIEGYYIDGYKGKFEILYQKEKR